MNIPLAEYNPALVVEDETVELVVLPCRAYHEFGSARYHEETTSIF
jgi:hypothetical protein